MEESLFKEDLLLYLFTKEFYPLDYLNQDFILSSYPIYLKEQNYYLIPTIINQTTI